MNPSFYRRDRTNQEMDSSLTASLLLLSVVFMQFVSTADQSSSTVEATVGENVILPCKDPDQGTIRVAEWNRTDLWSEYVLRYRDKQINQENQHPSYKNRADLLVGQMKVGDASLILRNVATHDSGTYECRVVQTSSEMKLISTVSLQVSPPPTPPPPDSFPVWAKVLPVLLVLALVASVLLFYFRHRLRPERKVELEEKVEVVSGDEFVLLPFKMVDQLPGDIKVEWRDGDNRKVHVYQNGSDQPGEQDEIYKDRTEMDENLLKTGDLSLTLSWPTEKDSNTYTCSVSSWIRNIQVMKQVQLEVKVQQVMVESGVESVLLPCRTTKSLDKDVKVEWRNGVNCMVHMYQNGSDQPGEQNKFYRTRTKMDENLLKTGDLSLTLRRPTDGDSNIYTCSVYNRDRDVLMEKKVQLEVKDQQVEVEEGAESVKLEFRVTFDLQGADRVEWRRTDTKPVMKVHVYQNGSDRAGEQNKFYRTRTRMDENLLRNKDLSLTLRRPTYRDSGEYRCEVLKEEKLLRVKTFHLKVKAGTVQVQVQPQDTRTSISVESTPLMADQLV